MKKFYLLTLFTLLTTFAFSQATVSGIVTDGETDEPLIGASVLVKGSARGTVTDLDGAFSLTSPTTTDFILEVSYVGYKTILVDVADGTTDVGSITLSPGIEGLEEIVVTGVMDIVVDRMTPVAVSTITTKEILKHSGNVEFPELMKLTPSIYVANQSGGYGDSEVFTRGFDQTNTAFLLNGQPINGMEDGRMYWSNWSGMTDVATAIQVQRGLGSSKLAISSVGGTTNIIMKPTAQAKGGSASLLYGNDNYMKATVSYNTGMINDKFGVTALVTHWQGNGWAEGTKGQGQNYFLSAGYKMNDKNMFNFLITGAPQWHDQNFRARISDHYDANGDFNIKYNGNWGYQDGEYKSVRRNYYHKPVANLNWDLAIDDKSSLSTVLYGSWGRGGGTGPLGGYRTPQDSEGQLDWDATVANNTSGADNTGIVRASANNHSWYGLVTNYNRDLTENLSFNFGGDLRTYKGDHFRQVVDLLGSSSYSQFSVLYGGNNDVTATFNANPWSALTNYAKGAERVAYSNAERITYGGAFSQLEYATDKVSLYVQGALSSQNYTRFEEFYAEEADIESETINHVGYNLKGGASYALASNHTVFANLGYYSRQPFFDNLFLNFSNTIKPGISNENILGSEIGYKFANRDLAVNINLYRTAWDNRTITNTINDGEEVGGVVYENGGFINVVGLNQLHQGIELDFAYDVSDPVSIRGFASFGDWTYSGTATREVYGDDRELDSRLNDFDIDGVRVGGAAQTSLGAGIIYDVTKDFSLDGNFNHYSRLYSLLGATNRELELPGFNLIDVGASYNFFLASGDILRFRANVYNLLGEQYVSQTTSSNAPSQTETENWRGVNKSNSVAFGKTRTWNVSLRYSF